MKSKERDIPVNSLSQATVTYHLTYAGCPAGCPGSDPFKLFTYQKNYAVEGCFWCLDLPFYTQNGGCKQQPIPEGYRRSGFFVSPIPLADS